METIQRNELEVVTSNDDGDDDLIHYFCHDPNVSFCGQDISNDYLLPETEEADPRDCVVCEELALLGCKECPK